jgi:hypothetical protein
MTITSNRREFLKQFGAASVISLAASPPQFLARAADVAATSTPSNPRILVLIQLAGGNDGLNSLVPHGDPAYYKARPGIGIPKNQVLRINDHVGLHPRLSGLKELYDEGNLAIVQGVGYPQTDRSHFRSMDIWQSAQPLNPVPRDGWLGRALEWKFDRQPSQAEGLTIGTDKLPLAFVSGRVSVPTMRRLEDFQLVAGHGPESHQRLKKEKLNRIIQSPAQGERELEFLRRTTVTAMSSADRLKSMATNYKAAVDYPATGLANRLKLISQMIAAE